MKAAIGKSVGTVEKKLMDEVGYKPPAALHSSQARHAVTARAQGRSKKIMNAETQRSTRK
jgi:hypothetical protein